MIDTQILRIMTRRAPNYHTFDRQFCRDHFSICPCAECVHARKTVSGVTESPTIVCGRVIEDFEALGCPGYAIVSKFATCDAARRQPENYADFKLSAEPTPQELRQRSKSAEIRAPLLPFGTSTTEADGRATGQEIAIPEGGQNA